MRLIIDTETGKLTSENARESTTVDLYSKTAFELISEQWLKVGWNEKYTYTFSWMGRPIIQLPEDLIRIQEVIYRIKPDVIIETGIAHGGSLVFHASLCKAMEKGRVIGIDIDIRKHNREALERHELAEWITLIEGSSIDPQVVNKVKSLVKPGETVLVVLDSCHAKEHVLAELEAYADLVSAGSYVVATDGIMRDLSDVPRGGEDWTWNNPEAAAAEFVKTHPGFELQEPQWSFSESDLSKSVTHWPGAWLRRL